MKEGVSGVLVGVGPGLPVLPEKYSVSACLKSLRLSIVPPHAILTSKIPAVMCRLSPTAVSRRVAMYAKRLLPARTALCLARLLLRLSNHPATVIIGECRPLILSCRAVPHQSRHLRSFTADSVWPDIRYQRYPELRRRHQDGNGFLRRLNYPRNA